MILVLSLSEKPRIGWISILSLFGSELLSSVDSQATNVTLEGHEPILLGAAKMTLIILRGSLEEAFFWDPNLSAPLGHWNGATVASIFLLGPASPNGPTNSCNPPLCVPGPDGIDSKGSSCAS